MGWRGTLFDRESEFAQIEAVVTAAAGGSGGLVYIEGEPGIGKTRLLQAARSRAELLGLHVLSACGGELERDFSYGLVRQLFEGPVADAGAAGGSELLAGPAALAAVALGYGSGAVAAPSPDSPFPTIHGLYWLTANLAAGAPLLLTVDDAHWADAPSLRYVDYLAARLDGVAVSVLIATRPAEPDDPDHLLARIRDRRTTVLIRPQALGQRATTAVLREEFDTEPDPAFAVACQTASAGNPLYLHELIDALRVDKVQPSASAADLVTGLGPETVARSLMLRLARLPATAAAVCDAVAVLGSQAEVRRVAAVAGLSPDAVGEAADMLADANVLGACRPLGFVHPVVRQAMYAEIRPSVRASMHAKAAAVLTAEDRPATQVAPHIVACEPVHDERAVCILRLAAVTALGQGAPDLAQLYLRRALVEPPAAGALGDVLFLLGQAEAMSGQALEQSSQHLEEALARTTDPIERAERAEAAARVRLYCGDLEGAAELLGQEAEDAGSIDPDIALRLRAHQAAIGILAPPVAGLALQRLEALTTLAGETAAELATLAELAGSRWLEGCIAEAAGFAERAISDGRLLDAEGPLSVSFNHAVAVLIDADRYELALPAIEAAIALARVQGSVLGTASLIGMRTVAAWRKGAVVETEADARAVLELVELSPTPVIDPAHWGYLAVALTERGALAEAEEAIAHSGRTCDVPLLTYMGIVFFARAHLRLAQGRPGDALEELLELRSRCERLGVKHLRIPWHRSAVEACVALGEPAWADVFAQEQLELTKRWDSASARGLALSTKGLASRGPEQIELLRSGATLLASSPARLDHARALVDLGAALRRQGRRADAREPLRAGFEAARRCGSTLLAARAHDELTAAGAKPRRLQFSGAASLTASEWRVAQLAARGESNRDIAAALFISTRTVENHLSRTYRKLDISSRAQLQTALGTAEQASASLPTVAISAKDEWSPLMTR